MAYNKAILYLLKFTSATNRNSKVCIKEAKRKGKNKLHCDLNRNLFENVYVARSESNVLSVYFNTLSDVLFILDHEHQCIYWPQTVDQRASTPETPVFLQRQSICKPPLSMLQWGCFCLTISKNVRHFYPYRNKKFSSATLIS